MFIKKESIDSVFAKTLENFKMTGIHIKPAVMKRFEDTLSEIAANSAYEEGAEIKESDLMKIINETGLIFNDIASGNKEIQKPVNALMTVTDYLYAMAMQKLGSPDMPALFGPEMQKNVFNFAAKIIGKQSLKGGEFADRVYWAQRGKDAADISKNEDVKHAIDAAKVKAATPAQVEQLVAEYQALAKRQNGHGFFWRIFHSKENDARTELLSQMEGALKTMLGDNANLKNSPPSLLAEGLIKNAVENEARLAFAKNGMEKRGGISAKDLVSTAKQIDSKIFFKTGYRPDLENIEHEWNAVKPIYDAAQRGEIFGEKSIANNTVKELLSKNYIRIQLFKAKVEKDGVESARGLLDQMEPIYTHEDAQFNKANPDYAVPEIPVSAQKEKIEEPKIEEPKIEEPAVEKTVEEKAKTEDAPEAEESKTMKLEAKENPFQHDVNRRKGKDRRQKAKPPKPFNKKAEFSSANVIAEYENEDDVELDAPNELRSKEPMEDEKSANVNKRRAEMLKNVSRIRNFPEEGFKKAFKLARGDGDLTKKVKAELADALAKGKICEEYDIEDCVDKLFALVGRIERLYMPRGVDGQKSSMGTYVYQMFDAVSNVTDLYDFESPEDRIIQSQKLTDVLLRNYPPISNANGRLDTYAHNYVVNSDVLLTKFLANVGVLDHEIYGTTITGKGAVGPKERDRFIKPYDGTSILASIRSRVAMEERAQAIASMPEAEQTGPMREQMAIMELAEQVGGKETSSKVNEPDAVSKEKTLD